MPLTTSLVQNVCYENEFDLREIEPEGGTHSYMNGFAGLTKRHKVTVKWPL